MPFVKTEERIKVDQRDIVKYIEEQSGRQLDSVAEAITKLGIEYLQGMAFDAIAAATAPAVLAIAVNVYGTIGTGLSLGYIADHIAASLDIKEARNALYMYKTYDVYMVVKTSKYYSENGNNDSGITITTEFDYE